MNSFITFWRKQAITNRLVKHCGKWGMGMREKLIELVLRMDITDNVGNIVDFLIANGVTIPVRCKDCKHLTVYNSPTLYAYCQKTHLRFEPFKEDTRTHYCSYGERKTDDD